MGLGEVGELLGVAIVAERVIESEGHYASAAGPREAAGGVVEVVAGGEDGIAVGIDLVIGVAVIGLVSAEGGVEGPFGGELDFGAKAEVPDMVGVGIVGEEVGVGYIEARGEANDGALGVD